MNLIDAIRLYTHVLQQAGGGLEGRRVATKELLERKVSSDVVSTIAEAVSNDGHLTSSSGCTFAITQITSS